MSATVTAQIDPNAAFECSSQPSSSRCCDDHLNPPQYTSEQFQRLMADHGVVCSMSRAGNVWHNAAMESFFSSLKTERTARKTYRTRDEAKADVFDYIDCFYNPWRRHSTIGYLSPMEFEKLAQLAWDGVHQTGSSSVSYDDSVLRQPARLYSFEWMRHRVQDSSNPGVSSRLCGSADAVLS